MKPRNRFNIYLDDETFQLLESYRKFANVKRSPIVKEALKSYLQSKKIGGLNLGNSNKS